MVVGALVLGFGAWTMVLKPMLFPPHYKPGEKVPAGKIVSLPQNTINLSDGHLLQVTVALQLTAPAETATLAEDDPKFLNAEIDVFGCTDHAGPLEPSRPDCGPGGTPGRHPEDRGNLRGGTADQCRLLHQLRHPVTS